MTRSNRHWNQQLVNGSFSRYNVVLMDQLLCRVFSLALLCFLFYDYAISEFVVMAFKQEIITKLTRVGHVLALYRLTIDSL